MINLGLFNWDDGDEDEVRICSRARHEWELVCEGDQWGIRDRATRAQVLPCEFDNAFFYGLDAVVLCTLGKWGAVEPSREDTPQEQPRWIAECEYDTFEALGWDFLFTKRGEVLFYHCGRRKTWCFDKARLYGDSGQYLLGEIGRNITLIDCESGEVIWEDSLDSPYYLLGDAPCLAFMGMHGENPLFFDATYGGCLVPEGGSLVLREDLGNAILTPIIVNGQNVLDIVIGEHGEISATSPLLPGVWEQTVDELIASSPAFTRATIDLHVALSGEEGEFARTIHLCDIEPEGPNAPEWPYRERL